MSGRCQAAWEVGVGVTYKSVQERLREAGIVMSKKGEVHRINYFGGLEETALYTTSLEEAMGLGMARPERL
ncbi:MAG: hypothetical protein E5W97_09970 [Mesorhizobium sp.]|nr:MAG: hypothetical protein E5W97_09970 [Mesorhizobium sp.]